MSFLQVDDLFIINSLDLDNILEVIVHYLLIGGMIGLNYQDVFSW